MVIDGFDIDGWIGRLARALARLETKQRSLHWRELNATSATGARDDEFPDPSNRFGELYFLATNIEQSTFYEPIRATLLEIQRILLKHPSLGAIVDASSTDNIWIELPGSGSLCSPTSLIAGLMARGLEAGKDGFRIACSELSLLLEPAGGADPARAQLLTGYHIALLQGLTVDEEVRIGDNLMIVPFKWLANFVNEGILKKLAPELGRHPGNKSITAVVKPFHWEPKFCVSGESAKYDVSERVAFAKDAGILIELLALFHAAPIAWIASFQSCVHRRARLLLGSGGYSATISSSSSRVWKFVEAEREALDGVARVFAIRSGACYQQYAPVISRLAAALARQGRFQTDDRILDVAIALEQLYELDHGEISFKLKTRAAVFLETQAEARLGVFKDVQALYDARSGIVHGRGGKGKASKAGEHRERQAAFDKGFDIARRSITKLLREGPPRDWNEMVLGA